jgi:hypothetical protein
LYAHNANGHSSSTTVIEAKEYLPPPPQKVQNNHQVASPSNVNKALPTPAHVNGNGKRVSQSSFEDDSDGTVGRTHDRDRDYHQRDASYGSTDSEELRIELERTQLGSPVPPTMLDSVVLPAIASVS